MKIEIDVDVPEGYEATGEYRTPYEEPCIESGAFYESAIFGSLKSIILRKKTRKVIVFVPDPEGNWAESLMDREAFVRVPATDDLSLRYRREEREESV